LRPLVPDAGKLAAEITDAFGDYRALGRLAG
jgi:hypothetical protein